MEASVRNLTAAERAALDGDDVAEQNGAAAMKMVATMSLTGQCFVQAGNDAVPLETSEEGMPFLGRDKFHSIPNLPDHNDGSGEVGTSCAGS